MVRANAGLLTVARTVSGDSSLLTWFHLPGEQALCGSAPDPASIYIKAMRINTKRPRIWEDVEVTTNSDTVTPLIWLYTTVEADSMMLYRWYTPKGEEEHVLVVSDDGSYSGARKLTQPRQEAFQRLQRLVFTTGQPPVIIHKILQILGGQADQGQVQLCLDLLDSITKHHPRIQDACRILEQFRSLSCEELGGVLIANYGLSPDVEPRQAIIISRAVRAVALHKRDTARPHPQAG